MTFSKWITLEDYKIYLAKFSDKEKSLYHSIEWINLLKNSFGVQIKAIATFNNNQKKILSLVPYVYDQKFFLNFYGSPLSSLFTLYMGPIFLKEIDTNIRVQILISQQELLEKKADYVELGICKNLKLRDKINENIYFRDYKYTMRPTYIIDLKIGKDKVWKNFESRARNMIRKSIKLGVEIQSIKADKKWFLQFYNMLKYTYKKQKKDVPHPLRFYENLLSLDQKSILKCYSAFINGKIIANAIFVVNGDTKLFLSGTSNSTGMKLAANSSLQWHSIIDAIDHNLKHYDLGGLGLQNIDKFKKSFGGKITYDHRWVYKSYLIKILEPIARLMSLLRLFRLRVGRKVN